jgi:murein L,D-transpeptidase YcbB/YkuD
MFMAVTAGIMLLFSFFIGFPCLADSMLNREVQEHIRIDIESTVLSPEIINGKEIIHAVAALRQFYKRRDYQCAWITNRGPVPQVESLLQSIRTVYEDGLRPEDYHLGEIEELENQVVSHFGEPKSVEPRKLADLDLLLTDAFLVLSSHLLSGRINPESFDPEWIANRRGADLSVVLEEALMGNRVEETLAELRPPQYGYQALRQELSRYRKIAEAGGWPMIPPGPKLKKGSRDPRVSILRERLTKSGDFDDSADEDIYDERLERAVVRFQKDHGLTPDGIVGPATLEALNVPVEERIRQIELNMERWRWLPNDLGNPHILINMADFHLNVIDNRQKLMTMKIIVGKSYRRTPVFSGNMTYLVLNPVWNVPQNIAIKDKLPLIRNDAHYLATQNMRVLRGWGEDESEVDPATIDWASISTKNFIYHLRQEPGPQNPLGRVKFMFPNRFDVYIHDTPNRELFEKTERTFSSGCIRIENPIDLAEFALRDDPKWTRETILAAMDKGSQQIVKLPRAICVHLLYWTAFVDDDGTLQFRKDIYGRDRKLDMALKEKAPTF